MLIICSLEDALVPASSSINLYAQLAESNHTDIYLLATKHGQHAKILSQEESLLNKDAKTYHDVVQAFRNRYTLMYNDNKHEVIKADANILNSYKPSRDEIRETYGI